MDDDGKIYYPETIQEIPMPGQVAVPVASSSPSTNNNQTFSPQSIAPSNFPETIVAHETMSSSFNTQTRKILGEFSFGQLGAVKIGTYVNGVSGEISLTPNGITALNVNGVTTFALDGSSGDATFLGTLQAGTVVAGDNNVQIGGTSAGGYIYILVAGIPGIVFGVV